MIMRLSSSGVRKLPVLLLALLAAPLSLAGTWGEENWGQMYWGSNPISAPVQAPTVESIVADGSDLVVTITDYAPGLDGWSAITGYFVTCGAAGTVASDTTKVRIQGLEADTEYACTVEASNAQGISPSVIQIATTESAIQSLNIVIIRAALCESTNPPADC